MNYLQDQNLQTLESLPNQIREIAGAMLFLNAENGQAALSTTADFIQSRIESATALSADDVNRVLDPLASADMLIDNLKSKQPVLQSMFKVALDSSQKLKTVA